jgi:TonB family protein
MTQNMPPGTLLELPLIQERYGPAFLLSIVIHALVVVFFVAVPFLMPKPTPILVGTGPGGGMGGESYTVGVTDDAGGGAGLFKPALTPQPPAPPVEKPAKKEVIKEDPKAVALPDTAKTKKRAAEPAVKAAKGTEAPASNQIPDPDAKGAGGVGGGARGSGGGMGGGIGISIGSGSGGIGDNWYARTVESRIGGNWSKPIGVQQRIEIVYSFVVNANGTISDITKVKSCGNDALDLSAERAIRAANPLTQPPPELRSRPLLFMAQFVYPPDKQ